MKPAESKKGMTLFVKETDRKETGFAPCLWFCDMLNFIHEVSLMVLTA